ncbi:MAG TPA: protein-glutamate O-methyltransferase CheR [Polyangiaceae bacterium]|nr:protein-glutamate O-methyltransferase CheR [Polyangiaceae bacterium]
MLLPDHSTEELEVGLLLEAINARYGYDFRDYAPGTIQRRMRNALKKSGAANLGDLQHRVLTDPDVFALVFSSLTIQVTEMFRDPTFYLAFRERVVPMLRTYPHIKIWHAGCATGEEVYSTAILLAEEGLSERTQIYATDISSAAIDLAREGIYPEQRIGEFVRSYSAAGGKGSIQSFLTTGYGNLTFNQSVRQNIVFFQHDLVSDYALGEMQVVLCRNVLIYFGTTLAGKVISTLRDAVCRGGFLCLGRSERLPNRLDLGFEEYVDDERIYRRGLS